MKKVIISVVIFYDDSNILLQDRRDFRIRIFGEEYGFFGGKTKEGETSEETLKREIKEELNIELKDFDFFYKYVQEFKELDALIERNVFIAPMPDIRDLKIDEGKPFIIKFEESFNLKMMPGDSDILKDIYDFLK